jgi:hypothetical protein
MFSPLNVLIAKLPLSGKGTKRRATGKAVPSTVSIDAIHQTAFTNQTKHAGHARLHRADGRPAAIRGLSRVSFRAHTQ